MKEAALNYFGKPHFVDGQLDKEIDCDSLRALEGRYILEVME